MLCHVVFACNSCSHARQLRESSADTCFYTRISWMRVDLYSWTIEMRINGGTYVINTSNVRFKFNLFYNIYFVFFLLIIRFIGKINWWNKFFLIIYIIHLWDIKYFQAFYIFILIFFFEYITNKFNYLKKIKIFINKNFKINHIFICSL